MYRRQFLIGAVGAGLATAFVLKPSEGGASYSQYFKELNDELRENGPFKPAMLVDLDRLDLNIESLLKGKDKNINYRIVAKSLPSPELLGHIMKQAGTNNLMVFHQPFITDIAERFPRADILLGKPLPVRSAEIFYERFSGQSGFNPSKQLQWLIDSSNRLTQYQNLARKLEIKMRINIELDIGLHRGGLQKPEDLAALMDQILADLDHLEFSGFMGYDPHVVKLPKIIKSVEKAYAESQTIYNGFLDFLKSSYPQIRMDQLCLNGAGSPTVNLHKAKTVINDMSAGSCLVKPVDFDISTLQEFVPSSFIATPVLKKSEFTSIPSLESLKGLLSWWDPNTRQSFFIYGGKWMARYESPEGLRESGLYGTSTNQQLVTGSSKIELDIDDHVFLRPNQSEFVFLQFGDLLAVKDGKILNKWPILKQ
jgi:D-serine deaminase-like pyridoxal phosphate-dependent protein